MKKLNYFDSAPTFGVIYFCCGYGYVKVYIYGVCVIPIMFNVAFSCFFSMLRVTYAFFSVKSLFASFTP